MKKGLEFSRRDAFGKGFRSFHKGSLRGLWLGFLSKFEGILIGAIVEKNVALDNHPR